MAEHLKVPVVTYNCYEDGKLDIPASILIGIARKLNVDTGLLLTGEESKMNIFTITRKDEAVEVERRKQYRYQSLARKFAHKKAEPFIVTIDPGKEKKAFYSHPGQEFEYVLKGSLKITIHDNEVVLNEGDSIYLRFIIQSPHGSLKRCACEAGDGGALIDGGEGIAVGGVEGAV